MSILCKVGLCDCFYFLKRLCFLIEEVEVERGDVKVKSILYRKINGMLILEIKLQILANKLQNIYEDLKYPGQNGEATMKSAPQVKIFFFILKLAFVTRHCPEFIYIYIYTGMQILKII